MSLGEEKYISLTTFTRDGRPKPTPVWIARLGDSKYGFTTDETSWKAKRIRNSAKVLVQPSNMRGVAKPGTKPLEATAEVVTGAAYEAVSRSIAAKYGWQYSMTGMRKKARKLFGKDVASDCGIVITTGD